MQYFVPAKRNRMPAVILMHGGGMTGTTWETTPDGRPGWLHLLLAQGFEVHVVDGVERAAAPDGVRSMASGKGDPLQRPLEEAWTLVSLRAKGRLRPAQSHFEGQRFPVGASGGVLARSFRAALDDNDIGCDCDAFHAAVLERVGPAIVICHSQGGEIAFSAGTRSGRARHSCGGH